MKVQKFKARIELIGITPFVFLPGKILKEIFRVPITAAVIPSTKAFIDTSSAGRSLVFRG